MAVSSLERLAYPTSRSLSLPRGSNIDEKSLAKLRNAAEILEGPLDQQEVTFNCHALNAMFDRLELRYERSDQALRCLHGDPDKPCYTEALLTELLRLFATLRNTYSGLDRESFPFRYFVLQSSKPQLWNLGGDLALFIRLIEAGDVEALRDYAYRCVHTVYQYYTKSNLPYLTIALVQGDALGGGFEAVLANDIIIAEEQCQFGLPEILFNMFPGMGAYSFLSRKLDPIRARSMILSGRLYSAGELHDLGLIDVVVPKGEAEAGLRTYLDRNRRRHRAHLSMANVGRRCHDIGQDEMIDVADIWVENAMGVSSSDRRRMQRLVNAQLRRHAPVASGSM